MESSFIDKDQVFKINNKEEKIYLKRRDSRTIGWNLYILYLLILQKTKGIDEFCNENIENETKDDN